MKVKFKSKVKRGVCFDENRQQYIAERMVIAPRLKASHLIKEIDFSNLSNCSRLDRLAGGIPSFELARMANDVFRDKYIDGRVDLDKHAIKTSGFLATIELKLA